MTNINSGIFHYIKNMMKLVFYLNLVSNESLFLQKPLVKTFFILLTCVILLIIINYVIIKIFGINYNSVIHRRIEPGVSRVQ